MKTLGFGRHVLGIGLGLVMLPGCGGTQTGGPLPIAVTGSQAAAHNRSWMLQGAKTQELIYASGGCGGTCVISYPNGKLIGSLDQSGLGACADASGNVFLTQVYDVVEYEHGGTSPINTLNTGYEGVGCSVDPITENLAVVVRGNSGGDIAVFAHEQGTPAFYNSHVDSLYCGYDNSGNLFVDGYGSYGSAGLAELKNGSSIFTPLTVNSKVGQPGQVQWDGSHITYESRVDGVKISRLRIRGTIAKIVGETRFRQIKRRSVQSWIYGSTAFVPYGTGGRTPIIGVWQYPKAGKPLAKYKSLDGPGDFQAVTVSIAPSGSRIRR